MPTKINIDALTGQKIAMLTILKEAGRVRTGVNRETKRTVECLCDCGGKVTVQIAGLLAGKPKSCGCTLFNRQKKILSKFGVYHRSLLPVWHSLLSRCYNENHKHYDRYGGRGITVCEVWKNDFVSFYSWVVLNGWKKGLQIDRVDNNGNYEPGNCRIATAKQNCRNTRRNRLIEYNGQLKTLSEWKDLLGFHYDKVRWRLDNGWSIADSFNKN